MTLTSMKLTAAEKKDGAQPSTPEGPRYPYGLTLSLDNDTLEKLGMKLPDVGDTLMIVASAKVTSVSENEDAYGGKVERHRNASVQIVAMAVSAGDIAADADKKLYKG